MATVSTPMTESAMTAAKGDDRGGAETEPDRRLISLIQTPGEKSFFNH
jgi:hypothetical protein